MWACRNNVELCHHTAIHRMRHTTSSHRNKQTNNSYAPIKNNVRDQLRILQYIPASQCARQRMNQLQLQHLHACYCTVLHTRLRASFEQVLLVSILSAYCSILLNPAHAAHSCSTLPDAPLFVILVLLHVSVLDVLPLSLSSVSARRLQYPRVAPTPRFTAFQMLSDPVSKALDPVSASPSPACPSRHRCTYTCVPKATPNTVNNMAVLLRRTALQSTVSRARCQDLRRQ